MFDIKSWIPNIFLLIIFFSSLSCFSRPDYNLPLFIFAYMIWFLPNSQKVRFIYLLIFTCIIDFIWLCYWGTLWNSDEYESEYASTNIHNFIIAFSSIELFIKIVLFVLIFKTEDSVKEAFSLEGIKENIVGLFTFN